MLPALSSKPKQAVRQVQGLTNDSIDSYSNMSLGGGGASTATYADNTTARSGSNTARGNKKQAAVDEDGALLARVVRDRKASGDEDLTLRIGDVVKVLSNKRTGYLKCEFNDEVGYVPSSYLEFFDEQAAGDAEPNPADGDQLDTARSERRKKKKDKEKEKKKKHVETSDGDEPPATTARSPRKAHGEREAAHVADDGDAGGGEESPRKKKKKKDKEKEKEKEKKHRKHRDDDAEDMEAKKDAGDHTDGGETDRKKKSKKKKSARRAESSASSDSEEYASSSRHRRRHRHRGRSGRRRGRSRDSDSESESSTGSSDSSGARRRRRRRHRHSSSDDPDSDDEKRRSGRRHKHRGSGSDGEDGGKRTRRDRTKRDDEAKASARGTGKHESGQLTERNEKTTAREESKQTAAAVTTSSATAATTTNATAASKDTKQSTARGNKDDESRIESTTKKNESKSGGHGLGNKIGEKMRSLLGGGKKSDRSSKNTSGILNACPNTVQGEEGWYEHGENERYYFVLLDGKWSLLYGPMTEEDFEAYCQKVLEQNRSVELPSTYLHKSGYFLSTEFRVNKAS